jgi:hypothetical protein
MKLSIINEKGLLENIIELYPYWKNPKGVQKWVTNSNQYLLYDELDITKLQARGFTIRYIVSSSN